MKIQPTKLISNIKGVINEKQAAKMADRVNDFAAGYRVAQRPAGEVKEMLIRDSFTKTVSKKHHFWEGVKQALSNKK